MRVACFIALFLILEVVNYRIQGPKIKRNPLWQSMIEAKCSGSAEAHIGLQQDYDEPSEFYDEAE